MIIHGNLFLVDVVHSLTELDGPSSQVDNQALALKRNKIYQRSPTKLLA